MPLHPAFRPRHFPRLQAPPLPSHIFFIITYSLVKNTPKCAVLGDVTSSPTQSSEKTARLHTIVFHAIFFPGKDNWLLDPVTDPIILLLTQAFFRNCSILILAVLLFSCAALILHNTVPNARAHKGSIPQRVVAPFLCRNMSLNYPHTPCVLIPLYYIIYYYAIFSKGGDRYGQA